MSATRFQSIYGVRLEIPLDYKDSKMEENTFYNDSNMTMSRWLSSSNGFEDVPFIYERNLTDNKAHWKPRIDMLETAFATNLLFSISIVPKSPSIIQTWHQQKATEEYDTEKYFQVEKDDLTREVPILKDNRYQGFLKPYFDYQSIQHPHDQNFKPINKISLSFENEIEDHLEKIESENLKKGLKATLIHFLNDSEAKQIGLLYLQPDHASEKTQRAIFVKPFVQPFVKA